MASIIYMDKDLTGSKKLEIPEDIPTIFDALIYAQENVEVDTKEVSIRVYFIPDEAMDDIKIVGALFVDSNGMYGTRVRNNFDLDPSAVIYSKKYLSEPFQIASYQFEVLVDSVLDE